MTAPIIPTDKPKFRRTTMRAEVDNANRTKTKNVIYRFSGKVFLAEDVPGKRP